MVSDKKSKQSNKKEGGRGAKFAYKKSRSVKVCTDGGRESHANKRTRWSRRIRQQFSRNRFRKEQLECPGAPHNTTSFLINFHKSNSSNDLVGKYCRREVLSDLRDRYEVESVVQT
jgi:hypothetical protein